MISALDQFYYAQEEPIRSCLLALRSIILEQDTEVSETRKYGMPCFTYKKKAFCYLWTEKASKQPYLLMVKGQSLTHPQLEQGSRKRMKILRVEADKDLQMDLINSVLQEALDLYR